MGEGHDAHSYYRASEANAAKTAADKGKAVVRTEQAASEMGSGTKLLPQFNSVESIINFSTFEQLRRSNKALQAYIKGNGEAIFKTLTQGGLVRPDGKVLLKDGTILSNHISKTSGKFTLDINKAGKIYKIRIDL